MSGDWRRLHQVRGVCSGSPENHWVTRLPWPPAPRCFEAEDTRRDRKACVEAKQVALAGHPSDEEIPKTSKSAFEGLESLVIR
jgi:hypothetical protein